MVFYRLISSVRRSLIMRFNIVISLGTEYDVNSEMGNDLEQPFKTVVDPMQTNNNSLNSLAAQSPRGNGSGWLGLAVCYWAIVSAAIAVFDSRS